MSKKIITALILLACIGGLAAPDFVFAQTTSPSLITAIMGPFAIAQEMIAGQSIADQLAKGVGAALLTISALILNICAWFFDKAVELFVIKMPENIGNGTDTGKAISQSWATLRDIANLAFIFVLLYAAIKAMFELSFSGVSTTIRNIIIAALLINFSLFFSKVVIDASNVVSMGFYKSIVSANIKSVSNGQESALSLTPLSGAYTRLVGLQSWNAKEVLNNKMDWLTVLTVGIMSSIFFLLTSVIFVITAIMFTARFIILIILMILSPLAVVAAIIPKQGGHFETWKNALIDQSIFAPVFLALTWVALKVGSGTMSLTNLGDSNVQSIKFAQLATDNPKSTIVLVINYVIVMGLSVAALIFAKKIASSTPGFSAVSSFSAGAVIGGAGALGRNTLGRSAKWVSENKREEWSKSSFGKAGLWLANKGSRASFDLRAADNLKKIPYLGKELGSLGKASGGGGFTKSIEDKAKRKAQYAKEVYGQTDAEKDKIKNIEDDYKAAKEREEGEIKASRKKSVDEAKKVAESNENNRKEYLDNKLKPNKEAVEQAKQEEEEKRKKLEENRESYGKDSTSALMMEKELEVAKEKVKQKEEDLKTAEKSIEETDVVYKELKDLAEGSKEELKIALERLGKNKIDDTEYSYDTRKMVEELEQTKNAAANRQEAYAKRLEGMFGFAGNKAAAKAVRKGIKGKTDEEQLAEIAEKIAKKKKEEEEKNKKVDKEEKTEEEKGNKTDK